MIEKIDLGSVPGEEPCAQVGDNDYGPKARRECRAYLNQLTRLWSEHHPDRSLPCGLRVVGNPHDFGRYYSVEAWWFGNVEPASEAAAFWLEQNLPAHWDALASQELASREIHDHA